jgi:S-adenosylmethionine-diacylglycerol 3-amino-3-carboxypropyl transferase
MQREADTLTGFGPLTLTLSRVRGRGNPELHANESPIRYAQVWEDADVLLAGLDVQPGDQCVSIASAGDNALALLTKQPARVIALDRNPAQLACLELRVAAYRELRHPELLELMGSRPSVRRSQLYGRCRRALSAGARAFWDGRLDAIELGIGHAGKFERYLALFRNRVLPLVHPRETVLGMLQPRSADARRRFHDRQWDTWRWRLLFRVFFSRTVMGWLGRDADSFRYVESDVATTILERTTHAFRELDPSNNPYVQWILTGTHGEALPYALRAEHFDTIRAGLDRLEWHCGSVEAFLDRSDAGAFDRFNLSDVFEYVSIEHYERMLESILRCSRPGARLAYWNMLAVRRRPEHLAERLRPLDDLAGSLHRSDRSFFYGAFRVEQVQ